MVLLLLKFTVISLDPLMDMSEAREEALKNLNQSQFTIWTLMSCSQKAGKISAFVFMLS